jgi:hypothetical protein
VTFSGDNQAQEGTRQRQHRTVTHIRVRSQRVTTHDTQESNDESDGPQEEDIIPEIVHGSDWQPPQTFQEGMDEEGTHGAEEDRPHDTRAPYECSTLHGSVSPRHTNKASDHKKQTIKTVATGTPAATDSQPRPFER